MRKLVAFCIGACMLPCLVASPRAHAPPPDLGMSPHFDFAQRLSPRRAPVRVPDGVWDRAGPLYVLPILVVASDRGQYAEDPDHPGMDFNGNAMHPTNLANFERAAANLSAHLQMARRMYHRMLRNPLNGEPRDTFRLARWNHALRGGEVVQEYTESVVPLVVQVGHSAASIKSQAETGIVSFVADVMAPLGCFQTSCPYVLMMVIVKDAGISTMGYKLNQGFDSGGGLIVFDWEDVRDANLGGADCLAIPRQTRLEPDDNWVGNGCRHFLSTLVHEIGHSFGLNHSWEYGGAGSGYGKTTSPSIMSYNVDNWIPGCGVGNESGNPATPCAYPPFHNVIDDNAATWPGKLLADDVRVLTHNRQAFGVLDYARALDTPNGVEPVLHETYHGYAEIPGQKRLVFVPSLSTEGYVDAIVGGNSEAILQIWEPWNPIRGWTTGPIGPGLWNAFQVIFPGPVELTRVRFYTAHGGSPHVPGVYYNAPLSARIGCSGCLDGGFDYLGSTNFGELNRTITVAPHTATTTYQIEVRHADQYVTLRGLRFWGRLDGGGEVELYPAGEPRATTEFGTWDGDVANIVGSDQTIRAFTDSWSPGDSWHSQAVNCGEWVSVTVAFPDDATLGYVKTHTGHSGQYHVPDRVQVERECVCRNDNNGAGGICDRAWSEANCITAGGPGRRVFEYVTSTPVDADHLIGFATRSAHRWKVAMHTPAAPDQCYVVVRGLRFFSPEGYELFPARSVPPDE